MSSSIKLAYMYIHIYIYIYIDTYIYIYIYIYIHKYIYISPYTSSSSSIKLSSALPPIKSLEHVMFIYTYIYKSIHVYIHIYTHIYVPLCLHQHYHQPVILKLESAPKSLDLPFHAKFQSQNHLDIESVVKWLRISHIYYMNSLFIYAYLCAYMYL
jgi:hypothetical protein